jgi:hypothetical protein
MPRSPALIIFRQEAPRAQSYRPSGSRRRGGSTSPARGTPTRGPAPPPPGSPPRPP